MFERRLGVATAREDLNVKYCVVTSRKGEIPHVKAPFFCYTQKPWQVFFFCSFF